MKKQTTFYFVQPRKLYKNYVKKIIVKTGS